MISLTLAILIIGPTNGKFFRRQPRQEVRKDLIIHQTHTSLTSCHLQCKMRSDCMGYGTETSNPVDGLFDCLFIGYDIRTYHEKKSGEETIGLFVVDMVFIIYYYTTLQKISLILYIFTIHYQFFDKF